MGIVEVAMEMRVDLFKNSSKIPTGILFEKQLNSAITRLIQLNISLIHEFKGLHKGQSAYSWFRVLMSRTSYLLNTYPKLWELP